MARSLGVHGAVLRCGAVEERLSRWVLMEGLVVAMTDENLVGG